MLKDTRLRTSLAKIRSAAFFEAATFCCAASSLLHFLLSFTSVDTTLDQSSTLVKQSTIDTQRTSHRFSKSINHLALPPLSATPAQMRLPPSPLSSGPSSPLLPVSFPSPTRVRNYKNIAAMTVFGTIAILLIVRGSQSVVAGDYLERIRGAVVGETRGECPVERTAERGVVEEAGSLERLVVRVRPEGRHATTSHPSNRLSDVQFHPSLSSEFTTFFPTANIPSIPPSSLVEQDSEDKCGTNGTITHSLPILPPPFLRPGESNLFFSICTSPERVIEFAQPIWSHFLSVPSTPTQSPKSIMRKLWNDKPSSPPGCLIVDARGRENPMMDEANGALREARTGCVMRDSSRVGERYEMRVLGLINDAWEESERRRKDSTVEGGMVEWFVFG